MESFLEKVSQEIYIYFFLSFFIHMKSFSNEEQLKEVNYATFKFTIISDYTDLNIISTNRNSDISQNNFVLGLFYAKTNYLYGLGISAFSLYVEDEMYGIQISPLNFSTGNSIGIQAGIFNYSKNFYGAQLSLLNYSDDFYGAQLAPINFSNDLYGTQFGIYNKSRNTYGLQIGIFNHSDDFEGIQIGLINFAKNIKGFQIGIINVAEEQTGYSFGILSFLLNTGFAKMYFRYDTDIPLNIGIKAGSKYFYSIAEINIPRPFSNLDLANFAYIGV
ncbi:LA_2272 family surface repeat-containing protein, partial [Silvanigrella sp.]|uniref:LA_2272 family surface repeat-containing protein n=1 Tax=Silvanigrella sp. TaxID=2024976 RepID=UPI0037CA7558